MSPCLPLLYALCLAAPQAIDATTLAHCAGDRPRTLSEVEARNAWAMRCAPHVATVYSGRYPQGSFAAFLRQDNGFAADAPCPEGRLRPIRCHAEGLLAGQRVLTELGYFDVASLEARGVERVAAWDSTKPYLTALPMSQLKAVVRRPYRGPVILLETDLGATLDVTAGQPVLLRNGTMVRADALRLGDVLLGFDGQHHVERVSQVHRDTFIYQLYLHEGDFDHNAVFAEDLFTGSARLGQMLLSQRSTP